MWLAKEEEGLEAFRSGLDIYKVMAADIFQKHYDEITDEERFFGKQAILGLGYSMGWKKFQATCKGHGVEVSDQLARKTVSAYRRKFKKIVQGWKSVEKAAINAVKNPGSVHTWNYISFKKEGKFLKCKLPSGRFIYYFDPKVTWEQTDYGEKQQLSFLISRKGTMFRERTYGGKIMENIDQASSRDLLCYAAIRLDRNGLPMVLSVHDEMAIERIKKEADIEEMYKYMRKVPKCYEGLPVDADGWVGKRFRKS